ncbi:MAG: carbon monoxide dehydrogenase subunit G [Betaproteobacteria bacterium]
MTGEQLIAASQQDVWDALNNPEVLKACIPGCEAIAKTSDDQFTILMLAAVGPVKAKFNGKLRIDESDPPRHYVLTFEGSGGAAGFGKGSAAVTLTAEGTSTRLAYVAKAQVGGKLAQVGSRLIDGVARKMATDFFNRLDARFAASAAPADTSTDITAQSDDATSHPSTAVQGAAGIAVRWKWVIIAAVVVLVAYLVLVAAR